MLGCFKDLGYNVIEKIYYMYPTFGMNMLVDDNGALEIADIYKVHLSVYIYIQYTLSQPEYYDGPLDEILVEKNDIANESEKVLAAIYEEVVNDGFRETELKKIDARETDVRETGGEVHDDVSSDENKDNSFYYDIAMEVAFDDESDEYDDELVEKYMLVFI